jgi:hypothetical protein
MKNIVLLALLHTFPLLAACSKSDRTTNETPESEERGNSCLPAYKEKLDGLLTLEKAAATAGRPKEAAKQKYSRVMKNPSYHSAQYVWKSGREQTLTVLGKPRLVPVNDLVELHGLKEVTLDYFKKSHRAPTQEQLDASKRQVDKAIDGKSDNAKVNAQVKKLDELKVDKETQKSTASELNSVFAQAAQSYSDVTGVGQAAAWNAFENRLYVFDSGIELALTVNVSNDGAVNKQKAITLARELIRCK